MMTFKEEYNPNFNDEGVKRAVRAWDDYAARDTPEIFDGDYQDMIAGAGEIEWSEFEGQDAEAEEESDVANLFNLQSYLPASLQTYLSTQLTALRALLISNGILANTSLSSPSSADSPPNKAVQAATDRLNTQRRDLDSAKRSITDHESDLTKDYGADDVFRTLKGNCISLDSGEYTYELCWLDRVTQKSKKGHSQQGMGNFKHFDTIVVDEDERVDGKGLGSGERVVLVFEGGSHCWNGPARSTTVVLGCAEREEVWRVREEEKCVYRMEVGTPAVCGAGGAKAKNAVKEEKEGGRDEL